MLNLLTTNRLPQRHVIDRPITEQPSVFPSCHSFYFLLLWYDWAMTDQYNWHHSTSLHGWAFKYFSFEFFNLYLLFYLFQFVLFKILLERLDWFLYNVNVVKHSAAFFSTSAHFLNHLSGWQWVRTLYQLLWDGVHLVLISGSDIFQQWTRVKKKK